MHCTSTEPHTVNLQYTFCTEQTYKKLKQNTVYYEHNESSIKTNKLLTFSRFRGSFDNSRAYV